VTAIPITGLLVFALAVQLGVNRPAAAASIVATISFGTSRAGVIVANPATGRVYAAQEDVPAIAVIEGTSIVATVPTLGYHTGIDVDPLANRIYVAQQFARSVRVIDGTTNIVVTDCAVSGAPINGVAVNSATKRLYVPRKDTDDVAVLDATTCERLAIVRLRGGAPIGVAVNSTTNRIYVATIIGGGITVIDGADNSTTAVTASIIPGVPQVNAVTNRIFVPDHNSNSVSVIDGATNTVVRMLVRGNGNFVCVDTMRNRLAITEDSRTAAIMDATTFEAISTVTMEPELNVCTFVPGTGMLYVTNDGGGQVTVVEEPNPTSTPTSTVPTVDQDGPTAPRDALHDGAPDEAVLVANLGSDLHVSRA
jgi:DNA-binding beta-propeller fold protein YncE